MEPRQANAPILYMGNNAIARGAIEAGVRVVAGYPGTPSSEILSTIARDARKYGMHVEWSTNEKVAYEVAYGAALSGVRALMTTKHLGVNVLSDALLVSAYTGVNGGLVIVTADDIHPFSSQNAEDTRYYAKLAKIPCIEPSNVQEAKDMIIEAFELSEKLQLPVLFRVTDRICHAKSDVVQSEIKPSIAKASFIKEDSRYVMIAPNARKRVEWLNNQIDKAAALSENHPENRADYAEQATLGVIASGVPYEHTIEALDVLGLTDRVSVLKLTFTHPLPKQKIAEFLRNHSHVLVAEEIEPIIETEVSSIAHQIGLDTLVHGRLDGYVPREHELTPDRIGESIARILSIDDPLVKVPTYKAPEVIRRIPNLCAGCPHAASYYALKLARRKMGGGGAVTGDRGCYNQGTNPPLSAIDTCVCMGASISMASGLSHAGVEGPIVAVIGDSTFLHNGVQPLINAVHNKANITVMILDNGWTGMTGHQPNPNTGINVLGEPAPKVSIEKLVEACGVQHLQVVSPYNVDETTAAIVSAMQHEGPAVVVSRQVCPVQDHRIRRKKGEQIEFPTYTVNTDQCTGCLYCVNNIGCPALDVTDGKVSINPAHCIGCGVCAQICPTRAIKEIKQ
ncbi:indolepyruvate ferredoxin oxidoreductase subunit alpha [Candidatus Bathyarchaeota archaeon]|nr:MAG: indolepyruvate ferredoxin oxidoreductase subunit alpha [Candidatus Bathyarchaeota archaeon]